MDALDWSGRKMFRAIDRPEPVRLAAAEQILGAVEHTFFLVGQRAETMAVDLVEDAVYLGAQIAAVGEVDFEFRRTGAGGLALAGPFGQLEAGGPAEAPIAFMDVAKINPAGHHAAEVGGMREAEGRR